MPTDFTQAQGSDELLRAMQLSQRSQPPCQVPGYEPRRFLGAGAYGEVWVGIDRTTGRQVAIKFYLHRGGLDWSLLSHEVEKLAFLSADRYVVQLLDVGWDSEPPYYVMEYVEHGSLDERLAKARPTAGRRGHRTVSRNRRGPDARARQRRAALRSEAGQRAVGSGRQAAVGRFRPVATCRTSKRRPWARCFTWPRSRPIRRPCPTRGGTCTRWARCCTPCSPARPPHRSEQALKQIEAAPDLDQRLARYRKLIVQSPPPTRAPRNFRASTNRWPKSSIARLAADPRATLSDSAGGARCAGCPRPPPLAAAAGGVGGHGPGAIAQRDVGVGVAVVHHLAGTFRDA